MTRSRRPMKDSGLQWIGPIPIHWDVKRLKFVSDFITSGPRGWGQYYAHEGAVFLRIGNVSRIGIDLLLDDIQRVMAPPSVEGIRTLLKQNDILVTITADIGSVGVIPGGLGEAYINQHMALVRVSQLQAHPRFIAYAAKSSWGKCHFDLSMQGGTKVGLGLDDVRDMPFGAAPYFEQESIAAYLDEKTAIDVLIEKKRKLLDLLAEERAALINQAVTKGLDPTVPMKDSGIPWIGEVPAHWSVQQVRRVVQRIEQGWSPLCENREADDDEWGVLKVGCVNGGVFRESEHKALPDNLSPAGPLEVHQGDLLMSVQIQRNCWAQLPWSGKSARSSCSVTSSTAYIFCQAARQSSLPW